MSLLSCKASLSCFLILQTLLFYTTKAASFEPYQLNGGLVAAVAGRDYCIVASDTRMSSGYEIYTRKYLSSRLWSTSQGSPLCNSDGSLNLPEETTTLNTNDEATWIASAGCAADCEALKRAIRKQVKAATYYKTVLDANHIATLLSQTLYLRRGFPYYSFCVVAGFSSGTPKVYVYDAIGSFENVAVATAGTGREVLQPILDRLFTETTTNRGDSNDERDEQVSKTTSALTKTMVRVVDTHVTCTAEQAVERLVRGYKSVSERDIRVGDSVVLLIIKRNVDNDDER